ncbi:dTDP-4-dehydrorhamnose 3,5-epimerase family protein [Alphaproteobacteria bacterium]|nr:dTDP-4-dehydrorhamnose 3,5-epimerase family protein [Alphaproteobacteria bacterium]
MLNKNGFHGKASKNEEGFIIWNDSDVNIKWPISNPKLSFKDLKLPSLKTLTKVV